jgi:hypothetical protein
MTRVEFGDSAARRRLVAAMRERRGYRRRFVALMALIFGILALSLHASTVGGFLSFKVVGPSADVRRDAATVALQREVKPMRSQLFVGVAALAAFAGSAFGVDRLVPEQYPTIQSAVDAASSGDTVSVAEGLYTESVDLRGKAITVSSRTLLGAQLRAPGDMRAIRAVSGESKSARVTGFRFIGNDGYGGGVLVSGSAPRIDHCSFQGVRNATGGGLLITSGSPRIEFCEFAGCIADVPVPGFGSGGAIRVVNGAVIVSDCTFTNNAGPTNAAGVMNESATVWILRCTFGPHHPVASIVYNGDSGNMTIEDCVFENDNSPQLRGAICFSWGSRVIRRCIFRDITLANAAINSSGGHTVVEDCVFARVTSMGTSSGISGNTGWASFAVGGSSFCGMTPMAISAPYEDLGGNTFSAACIPLCPADIVRDGAVNAADLAIVLVAWGTSGARYPGVDVDGSGVVDGSDLGAVLAAWGPCPQ